MDKMSEGFPLSLPELASLDEIGVREPTPVQLQLWQLCHSLQSVIFHAPNGSGKTIGYALFVLGKAIVAKGSFRCLVLLPNRELAFQVANLFNVLASKAPNCPIVTRLLIGGLSLTDDKQFVQSMRPSFLIGTCGRVLHLLKEGLVDFPSFDLIVMDEYDKLLEDKQFVHILKLLHKSRKEWLGKTRVLCLSATPTKDKVRRISKTVRPFLLHTIQSQPTDACQPAKKQSGSSVHQPGDPLREPPRSLRSQLGPVDINLSSVKQMMMVLSTQLKAAEAVTELTKRVLSSVKHRKALVFYNDRVRGEELWADLRDALGLDEVILFHSDLLQSQRLKFFRRFKHGDVKLAITTDVLARGVDFDNVDLVINFDVPFNIQTYFHRAGRCGRHGNRGASFLFLSPRNAADFLANQQFKVDLEELREDNFEEQMSRTEEFIWGKQPVFLRVDMTAPEEGLGQWEGVPESEIQIRAVPTDPSDPSRGPSPSSSDREVGSESKSDIGSVRQSVATPDSSRHHQGRSRSNHSIVDFLNCHECATIARTLEKNGLANLRITKYFQA
jgi:superfamily II DNA/RNA helicase